jgi:phage shock protein PspC (stress-responsive transcriptional regulator)/predicted membrane protein
MGTETRLLRRSRTDRTLAGVCGGLAAYFELHPAIFRVAFVALTLLGGAGVLIYLAAVLVMPDAGREDSIATAFLRRRGRVSLVVLVLAALFIGSVLDTTTLPRGDAWLVLLVFAGVVLWIAFGLKRWYTIALGSIVALGLVMAAIFAAVIDLHVNYGLEERRYVVANPQDLLDDYRLGGGALVIDLRSIRLPPGETRVTARVDAGIIRVTVPDDVAVRVRAEATAGRLDVLGRVEEGWHVEQRRAARGSQVLVLDTHVGVGTVQIRAVG